MDVLWLALGALIVAIGLVDVFVTVLHYDGPGIFALPTYRFVWETLRRATEILPGRLRVMGRSMAAPLMVVLTLVLWLGVQIVGFALLYYPAVTSSFAVGRVGRSFATALYVSIATLTSLSFGDVEPRTLAYHLVASLETLVGLGILTLSISYLLNLYRELQEQGVLASLLYQRSFGSNEPLRLLEPHFVTGKAANVSLVVRELHHSLVAYEEGVRRYPVLWYFHARRPYRSVPYIFWATAAVAGALAWAAPADHAASKDPWLPGLLEGFEHVLTRVASRFLRQTVPEPPEPVSLERFCARAASTDTDTDIDADPGAGDEGAMLDRFLELERSLHRLTRTDIGPPTVGRYDRYCQWLFFTARARAFVELASRDLGMNPELMYEDPGRIQV